MNIMLSMAQKLDFESDTSKCADRKENVLKYY